MAGQTLRVVSNEIVIGLFMRIVACKTADSPVIAHKALAICKAIGLESHVYRSVKAVPHCSVPGAMTLAAEIPSIFGVHSFERLGKGGKVVASGIGIDRRRIALAFLGLILGKGLLARHVGTLWRHETLSESLLPLSADGLSHR